MEEVTTKAQRVTLPIYGLGCGGGGALAVERTLSKTTGVRRAYVNPLTEMAYIEYDPALTDLEQLGAAVAGAGFGVGARMVDSANAR